MKYYKKDGYIISSDLDLDFPQVTKQEWEEQNKLTKEEVEATRRMLYIQQVDPITAHINRLRDEEQTEEIIAEIEALKAERSAIVEKIKSENPYPETVEEVSNLLGDEQNETISEENSANSLTETTDLMV